MAKRIRYLDRNQEPTLKPKERIKTFKEYQLGFSPNLALDEADRCLFCKDAHKRCIKGCPINIDIPSFIRKIKEGDILGAYEVITQTNPFPSICGRVCPQDKQCEGSCILYYDTVRDKKNKGLPVAIGSLERFVGDVVRLLGIEVLPKVKEKNGKRVALVGSGPSSLACAYELLLRGYETHIYEALPFAGGVMAYGIPSPRLSKEIIEWEVERLKKMGAKFFFGVLVGRSVSFKELLEKYDALFLGVGAGRGKLGFKGDHLKGVYSAIEVLQRVNSFGKGIDLGKRVCIVGGGFTAVDCAIVCLRLGLETHIVYRRTKEFSSARAVEWEHLQEDGAIMHFLTQPVEILGENGRVKALKCIKMELKGRDESGRPKPVPVENSEHLIECDSVIFAIGQEANPLVFEELDLERNKWGLIKVNERFQTSIPKVFAGGDAIRGGGTVAKSISDGRKAGKFIDEFLKNG